MKFYIKVIKIPENKITIIKNLSSSNFLTENSNYCFYNDITFCNRFLTSKFTYDTDNLQVFIFLINLIGKENLEMSYSRIIRGGITESGNYDPTTFDYTLTDDPEGIEIFKARDWYSKLITKEQEYVNILVSLNKATGILG